MRQGILKSNYNQIVGTKNFGMSFGTRAWFFVPI